MNELGHENIVPNELLALSLKNIQFKDAGRFIATLNIGDASYSITIEQLPTNGWRMTADRFVVMASSAEGALRALRQDLENAGKQEEKNRFDIETIRGKLTEHGEVRNIDMNFEPGSITGYMDTVIKGEIVLNEQPVNFSIRKDSTAGNLQNPNGKPWKARFEAGYRTITEEGYDLDETLKKCLSRF